MQRSFGLQDLENKGKVSIGKKINYQTYKYSIKELLLSIAEGMGIVILLGYFFYRSIRWTCLLSPLVLVFLHLKKKVLCTRRKQKLCLQFKDTLNSINSSLQAGYSMENAFLEAYKDMAHYYGAESMIAKELFVVKRGIQSNQPVEELILDMGERSGVEDILDFANVLMIGKRSGGNLNEIIRSSITVIEEKMETLEEVQTMLSSKKLEAAIMCVIPFFIILYMEVTSAGYFDSLYQTVGGNILMSICLGIYITAIGIAGKIINIEV